MAVELKSISKSFGAVTIIDDLSLKVERGEFLAFLGPSGCGKSTTLRMIAGLENPDSGQITIDGDDITSVPANKRPINMVFQSYALFPHMTVWDNIAYGLRRDGLTGDVLAARVEEGVRLVRLEQLADRKPSALSGGQQQRVALARSLVKKPKALLLDEPLGALDPILRHHMQRELKALQGQTDTTFIYVAHHQDEAFGLADRVCVMAGGNVVQLDTPEIVYRQPKDSFVASFIGQINRLPPIEGSVLDLGEGGCVRVVKPSLNGKTGYGVRPEAVRLGKPDDAEKSSWLVGKVSDIIFRGPSFEVEVETEKAGRHMVVGLQCDLNPPSKDDDVVVHWPNEQTMQFQELDDDQA
ncbi:MAG: ABC transporter ATP-binding protein [Pseudomonadota bacterium]